VPEETRAHYRAKAEEGARASAQWDGLFARYRAEFPELAKQWDLAQSGALPTNWDQSLKPHPVTESSATREASGATLNAVAPAIPWLIGGDADLGCSTNTVLKGAGSFEGQGGSGRNIHFGVREHAMAAIANGMCYHGGIRPFVATFFCFFDYMKPSVRLAAMNHLAPIYVWTHDSIGLGEDGPTHQPIEHLMALRAVPNVLVLRPCDANETQAAWKIALQEKKTPVALVLTRQKVATLDRAKYGDAALTAKGAYVLSEASGGKPKAILIATGSEVHAALEAQTQLEKAGTPVRVVSMPSWELFQRQTPQYRESVLPKAIRARVSVEAGVTLGWERWVGDAGVAIGIDRYGASAPLKALLENYGLTAGHIVKTVQNILSPV
ncbi:MAG: transketolase C-terminal domain-containing protein, partial [Bacteriovoracia bacterium]